MSIVTRSFLSDAEPGARTKSATSQDDETLDAEFLDYLGTLESDREDWTWFSEQDDPQSSSYEEATPEDAR